MQTASVLKSKRKSTCAHTSFEIQKRMMKKKNKRKKLHLNRTNINKGFRHSYENETEQTEKKKKTELCEFFFHFFFLVNLDMCVNKFIALEYFRLFLIHSLGCIMRCFIPTGHVCQHFIWCQPI